MGFKVGDVVIYTGNHPHDNIPRFISCKGIVVKVIERQTGNRYTVYFFNGGSLEAARSENLEHYILKPTWEI